ncbi:MAG: efflux RND transporter periplasmic adaptor subunit [Phycisphaerales bacterium]|nr:efflux RND transporter periplasmic adaptor subunit [Phycisphaerales bacterium]
MNTRSNLESMAGSEAAKIPQPKSRWALRFGIPILIIGLVLALLITTAWSALVPARSVRVATVALRPVEVSIQELPEMMEMGSVIQAPGWIEPDPYPTYVAALEEGVVENILKVEGDRVAVGEVVATLFDERARIRLARSEASLSLAMARQKSATNILAKASVELATRSEQALRIAKARSSIAQTKAEGAVLDARIIAARSTANQVEDELSRKSGLVEGGAIAEGVVIRLGMELEASRARVESLVQQKKANTAELSSAEAELKAAETAFDLEVHETIEVEKAKSRLVETAEMINIAQSERDDARLAYERCKVTSPVSGTVIELLSSPGSAINYGNGSHGSHILHVYDPKMLQVRADIPLADAAKVQIGQKAQIVVDVLPDTIFEGEVARFLHKADISKNTIEAKIRIDDPSVFMKPDMLARVRIMPMAPDDGGHGGGESSASIQRVFVPESAIVLDEDLTMIWVIEDLDRGRGRAALRTIELGEATKNGWVEVTRGMKAGDKVILDRDGLDQGDHVEIADEREA